MSNKDFKCILCNNNSMPNQVSNYVKGDLEKALRVVACSNCGHKQLFPPLYSLQYYNQDNQVNFVVHDYGTPMERLIEHSWTDAARRVLRFAEKGIHIEKKYKSSGNARILDVGGGYGFFGSEMKNSFPDSEVVVLEPSAMRIEKGQQYLNQENKPTPIFINGLLDNDFVNQNSGKFDIVTLWHVLEHVPDPIELLSNAVKIANPKGGIVCIELPNADDELIQFSSAFKNRSFMIEHISYFDKRTLDRLAFLVAPTAKCNVYGYQRYGVFNYMNWIFKNEPLGNNPDILEGEGRWWLEKIWKITRESANTSDTLFMTIEL
jgi:2-polyprenyl-3-methyl-5-hydroxy-6-metoxy-1,4-benzoquinol methylase/DNA-directed RNA polymerase subunit RPC12/RpoP